MRRVLNGLHGYAGQSLPKKITNCIIPINGKTGSYSKVALYYENHIGEDTVYGTDCHNGSFNVLYADLHVGSVKLGSMNYNQLTAPQYY